MKIEKMSDQQKETRRGLERPERRKTRERNAHPLGYVSKLPP